MSAARMERKQGLPPHSMAEGLRNTAGVIDEYKAFAAPWGFRLEDVSCPVDVWQGSEDKLVPPSWAHEISRRLPHATLHMLEGEGHMIGVTRRAEILRSLAS